jgi:TPR repeat protein
MNLLFAILIAAIPSVNQLQKSCKAGKGDACNELGNRYRLALSVKPSEPKAADAYKAACAAKDPAGCANDAFAKVLGLGQKKDVEGGVARLRAQCDAKVPQACGHLGFLTNEGIGVPQDHVAGEAQMEAACKAGDVESCANMANVNIEAGNVPRAEQFARAACDNGDAQGCATLADLYLGQHELVQAASRFSQSCDLGATRGCRGQALLLLEAGTNKPKALSLLDRCCSYGDRPSCDAAQIAREEKPAAK